MQHIEDLLCLAYIYGAGKSALVPMLAAILWQKYRTK